MIKADDFILQEIMKFISKKEQCQVIDLSSMSDILVFSNLEIHLREQIVYLNGAVVPMSCYEFNALSYLAKHPGWVFNKEQIYEAVYGNEKIDNVDNIIYCLIFGLRNKLEENSKHPKYIQTVWGVGYKFVVPEEN